MKKQNRKKFRTLLGVHFSRTLEKKINIGIIIRLKLKKILKKNNSLRFLNVIFSLLNLFNYTLQMRRSTGKYYGF